MRHANHSRKEEIVVGTQVERELEREREGEGERERRNALSASTALPA